MSAMGGKRTRLSLPNGVYGDAMLISKRDAARALSSAITRFGLALSDYDDGFLLVGRGYAIQIFWDWSGVSFVYIDLNSGVRIDILEYLLNRRRAKLRFPGYGQVERIRDRHMIAMSAFADHLVRGGSDIGVGEKTWQAELREAPDKAPPDILEQIRLMARHSDGS